MILACLGEGYALLYSALMLLVILMRFIVYASVDMALVGQKGQRV